MDLSSIVRAFAVVPFVACVGSSGTTSAPEAPDTGTIPQPGEDAAVTDGSSTGDSGSSPGDAAPCPIGIDETFAASVTLTADNRRKLYVNGALIDADPHEWTNPTTHPITLFRHPSKKNVIAVEGSNTSSQSGPDRGILVDVTWPAPDDAGLRHVKSDAGWRVSGTLATGWFDVAFDDVDFVVAVEEGKNGMAPWGDITAIDPDAKWIWTYDSNKDTSQKPNEETVYARKVIYFDMAGAIAPGPGACP